MASTSVDSDSIDDDSIDSIGAIDSIDAGAHDDKNDGKSPGVVGVLHDGEVGWFRRTASKSRLLRNIYCASHRMADAMNNFLDNHENRTIAVIFALPFIAAGASMVISPLIAYGSLLVLSGLMIPIVLAITTDQHAYPSGLILSMIMDGQPFIVTMDASIPDARMIEGEYVDRWKLARKYTRYSRIIENGPLTGCEVCSPYEIRDEDMSKLSAMAERTMWKYVAHHDKHGGYVGAGHGPTFNLVMSPSTMDTLDGFDATTRSMDADHVEQVESSLLMRLSLMRDRVADTRRMGESIGATSVSEVCDGMDELMDRIRDYDARWHVAAVEGKTDVMDAGLASIMGSMGLNAVSDPGLYLDSMASALGVLDARITDLGEQIEDIAKDQRDAEDLTRKIGSLSEDIAAVRESESVSVEG